MNNINLIGRLTKAPETVTKGETIICTFRVAVDGPRKEDPADFIPVTCFAKLAQVCGEHLTQGRQVAITGRLNHNVWVTPDGDNRERFEVIARDVEFLHKPAEKQPESDMAANAF